MSSEIQTTMKNSKLHEQSSLMPKSETGADKFIELYPECDGRGVLVAIFDSGVDPAARGLQRTSHGEQKIIDLIDCTGSGDINTSVIVRASADGFIRGISGTTLRVNSNWKNPDGKWHVGSKLVYELYSNELKDQRKKQWETKNQDAIRELLEQIKHTNSQMQREDLQLKINFLESEAVLYNDEGPILDAVVWHDGECWRAALDTQSIDPRGKLCEFIPMTNFRHEMRYGVLSEADACTFCLNVYNDGDVLSVVSDCSPHGTHVAGILSAYDPQDTNLNGVAPGAQIISCKVVDLRVGSMQGANVTGTALARALAAAVDHKCDLINISSGRFSLVPDYGRFEDLLDEVINKFEVIVISSVGNDGPALSTVQSPASSSSVIGVGAYISPEMAVCGHRSVETPKKGLPYTWSSRGPTVDGCVGVCITAPGSAVAPVPTWTLQSRMFMEGTSMAAPFACGGVALLVSGMKSEGIRVNAYNVREALENTCITSLSHLPDDKLCGGQGLLQVHKAYEYILASRDLPSIRYKVKIRRSGMLSPDSRGIYIREAASCEKSSEWTVSIKPVFHGSASNIERTSFRLDLQLCSSEESVVKAPKYLHVTNSESDFKIVVDPTGLSDELHFYEVWALDKNTPWRGSVFRIPITIAKPQSLEGRHTVILCQNVSFKPGHIERKFIEVPIGSTWIEINMEALGFSTERIYYIDCCQISPLQIPSVCGLRESFISPSSRRFVLPVVEGCTLEVCIAQCWSSGVGSNDATDIDLKITFHGFTISRNEISFDGSEAPQRIVVEAHLSNETFSPVALLNKVRVPHRPAVCKEMTLSTPRDKMPLGQLTRALILTYKFRLEKIALITPCIPLLHNDTYTDIFESHFYMIFDANNRIHSMGDSGTVTKRLPKGEYTLILNIRHDKTQYPDHMKQLVLFIEKQLEEECSIKLSFYSQPDGPITGNGRVISSLLVPGAKETFYVGPPPKDMLPAGFPAGSVLAGLVSYVKVSNGKNYGDIEPENNSLFHNIVCNLIPTRVDSESSSSNNARRCHEEICDALVGIIARPRIKSAKECRDWAGLTATLEGYDYMTHVLAGLFNGLVLSNSGGQTPAFYEEVIKRADAFVRSVKEEEFVRYADLMREAFYQKGMALLEIEAHCDKHKMEELSQRSLADSETSEQGEGSEESSLSKKQKKKMKNKKKEKEEQEDTVIPWHSVFENNLLALEQFYSATSYEYAMLYARFQRGQGRFGSALQVLSEMLKIYDYTQTPKKDPYELKILLLEDIGEWPHLVAYEKDWIQVRFPASLPLLG